MRVLVTGGAGYIGSHACKALKAAGYTPVTFDSFVTGWKQAVKFGPLEEGCLSAAVQAVAWNGPIGDGGTSDYMPEWMRWVALLQCQSQLDGGMHVQLEELFHVCPVLVSGGGITGFSCIGKAEIHALPMALDPIEDRRISFFFTQVSQN